MDDIVFKGRTVRGYGGEHGTPFFGVIRGIDYLQPDSIGLIVQILSEPKNTNIPRWLDILFPDEGVSFRVFCAVALFEEFDYPSIMIYGGTAYRAKRGGLTKSRRSAVNRRGDSFVIFWMESAMDGKVKGFFLHNCVYPLRYSKNLIFEDLLFYEGVPLTVNTNFASSRILVSPKMLVNFAFDSFANNHRHVKWKGDLRWGPRKLNAITNVAMAYNHLPEEVKLKGK